MSQTLANSHLSSDLSGMAPQLSSLSQFALITASGEDAVSFLQSQLTNDIKLLAENHACLAGYCTPKGRLLATMLIWKINDTITIELPKELQESLQKRLQMYVMRAKVKLEHVSAAHSVFGVLGASSAEKLATWFPTLPASPYELVANEFGTLIRVTDVEGMARYQCIVAKDLAEKLESSADHESNWALSEIHAGIPHITTATQEKFVPQMINYELIGGVNFKKGCYPGQEIVARTHYLGKQKRRTVLARIDSKAVQSGMEVFSNSDLSQPCGMVVNAEPNNAGGSDCLIEIKTAFLTDTAVQLSSGEICHWLAMPYSLPDDAEQSS
jgi:folate-binding protein YgfZ